MDNRIVFAVAGSGKTRLIVESIAPEERSLILTYTEVNRRNLCKRVQCRFGGSIPNNVEVYTYFTFLYRFCLKPFFQDKIGLSGISHDFRPPRFAKKSSKKYYFDSFNRVIGSRLAALLNDPRILPKVKQRVGEFFDAVYIDEIQDFDSHDFDFILNLPKSGVRCLYVGDFYQFTYSTSKDGLKRRGLHGDYTKYKDLFKQAGFNVDEDSLVRSWRCSPSVCKFVKENVGVNIESERVDPTEVREVLDSDEITTLLNDDSIVKLFYENKDKYSCRSENWGNSKGLDDFDNICVVVNPTTAKHLEKSTLHEMAPSSKNKFYVACTRARGNLYFINQMHLSDYMHRSFK